MITNKNTENIIESRMNMPSSGYRMDDANKGFFMKLMRDNVYEDIIEAVVREYTTNALDEHVTNKITKPVEITIPSSSAPTIKIRDFGAGLTPQGMEDVYISYGASNKRDTNDATGFMGIGCKCAAGYSRIYTITSIVKKSDSNWKCTYSAVLNEQDEGELKLLGQCSTTEHTGIEVSVPVKLSDISNFKRSIRKIYHSASEGKYRAKPKLLNIDNEDSFWRLDRQHLCKNENIGYEIYAQNDALGYNSTVIKMGNIYYPLNDSTMMNNYHLNKDIKEHLVNAVLNHIGLVVEMPIGSVLPAASRESLKYDEQTVKNLLTKLEQVASEIIRELVEQLNNTDCAYEQARIYFKMLSNHDGRLVRAALKEANIIHDTLVSAAQHWSRNTTARYPLTPASNDSNKWLSKVLIERHEVSYRGGGEKVFKHDYGWITDALKDNVIMIIDWDATKDGKRETKVGSTRKVKTLLQERNKHGSWMQNRETHVYTIQYSSKETKKSKAKLLKELRLDITNTLDIYDSLDVEPLKTTVTGLGKGSKAHVDLFSYKPRMMPTETWKEVTVSLHNVPTLFLPLSGYSGIKCTDSSVYTNNEICNKSVRAMSDFIRSNCRHIKDVKLRNYINDLKAEEQIEVYGSRKQHWKKLESLEISYNLYDVYKEVVKSEAKLLGDALRKHYCVYSMLEENVVINKSYQYNYKYAAPSYFSAGGHVSHFADVLTQSIPTKLAGSYGQAMKSKNKRERIGDIALHAAGILGKKSYDELNDLMYISELYKGVYPFHNHYLSMVEKLMYIEEWDTFLGDYKIPKDFISKPLKAMIHRNPLLFLLESINCWKLGLSDVTNLSPTIQRCHYDTTTSTLSQIKETAEEIQTTVFTNIIASLIK